MFGKEDSHLPPPVVSRLRGSQHRPLPRCDQRGEREYAHPGNGEQSGQTEPPRRDAPQASGDEQHPQDFHDHDHEFVREYHCCMSNTARASSALDLVDGVRAFDS